MKKTNDIPGPKRLGIFSCIRNLVSDSWAEQKRLHKKYGDIVYLKYPQKVIFGFHPEIVNYILKENSKNFKKGKRFQPLSSLLGNGLVISEGDIWKKSRRIVGNEFNPKAIKRFVPLFLEEIQEMIETWKKKCEREGGPIEVDINKEMMTLTYKIIGKALFGKFLGHQADIIQTHLGEATDIIIKRIMTGVSLPKILPTPDNLAIKRINNEFEQIVYGILDEKENPLDENGSANVLSKLMAANRKEGKLALSRKQMRDEIMTLMLAGHETTSNLLTWTFYLLSKSLDKEKNLLNDLENFDPENLEEKTYLDAVILESMRIFPPVPLLSRESIEEDVLLGYKIPKGTTVFVAAMITQNDPRFFESPETFSPERFLDKDPYQNRPGSYFPFGLGTRRCIGEEFALTEAKIILGTLFKNFHFSLRPGFVPKPVPSITLQAKTGLLMNIKPRTKV